MAKNAFVTEAKARRIINALHSTGISIKSVTVNCDSVTFHMDDQAERSANDVKRLHLPEDWSACPFDETPDV